MVDNFLKSLKEILVAMKEALEDNNLITLSHHSGIFTELFLKSYLRTHLPEKNSMQLNKNIDKLRGIIGQKGVPKLPGSKDHSVKNIQNFRNKNAHHSYEDFEWTKHSFASILESALDLYHYACNEFEKPEHGYAGNYVNLRLLKYPNTPSGSRQRAYDFLSECYSAISDYSCNVLDEWDGLEATIEQANAAGWNDGMNDDDNELSDELEDLWYLAEQASHHEDEIDDIMIQASRVQSELQKLLSLYESSSFVRIEHNSHYSSIGMKKISDSEVPAIALIDDSVPKPASVETVGVRVESFDPDGYLGDESLFEMKISVPDEIRKRGQPPLQNIISTGDAARLYDKCPNCSADISGIFLKTEWTKIYPAHCCGKFCYEIEDGFDSSFEEFFS